MPRPKRWTYADSQGRLQVGAVWSMINTAEIFDAIARYRAAYRSPDTALLGFWWHPSSRFQNDSSIKNGWRAAVASTISVVENILHWNMLAGYAALDTLDFVDFPFHSHPDIGPSAHRYFHMRVRSDVPVSLELYYRKEGETGWPNFVVLGQTSTSWQTLEGDFAILPPWNGKLSALRLVARGTATLVQIEYLLIDREDWRVSGFVPPHRATEITRARQGVEELAGHAIPWTEQVVAGQIPPRARHFTEIRSAINQLEATTNRGWNGNCDGDVCSCESGYGLSCTCNTTQHMVCSCDGSAHTCTCQQPSYSVCACDTSCNAYSAGSSCSCYGPDYVVCQCDGAAHTCTCQEPSYNLVICRPDDPCTCDQICYGYFCNCDGVCHVDSLCGGEPGQCQCFSPSYGTCACDFTTYYDMACDCDATGNVRSCGCYTGHDCACQEPAHFTIPCFPTCYAQSAGTPCTCHDPSYQVCSCHGATHICTCEEAKDLDCQCESGYGYHPCSCDGTCYLETCFTCDQYAPGS